MTHILCQLCAEWQGNVDTDKPIGWLELHDDTGDVVGWFWDHDCGRIVVKVHEMPRLLAKPRVRLYPKPISLGLVGPSGMGKDAVMGAAGDAIELDHLKTVGLGSGEGLLDQYVAYRPPKDGEPGGVDQHTESVVFTTPDVETLGALKGRSSSTLAPELRSAWGGRLGFAYANQGHQRSPPRCEAAHLRCHLPPNCASTPNRKRAREGKRGRLFNPA